MKIHTAPSADFISWVNRLLPKQCPKIQAVFDASVQVVKTLFSAVSSPFRWCVTFLCGARDYAKEFDEIKAVDVPLNQVNFSVSRASSYGNRYSDVLSNEYTRVMSKQDRFFYFNANWVLDGSVIASQGPLESDHRQFWKMVQQHDVRTIIMLTDLTERGVEKCWNYWASSPFDIPLKMESEQIIYTNGKERIVSRSFLVGDERRRVVQYHLQNFPDHGIVKTETLAFLVKESAKGEGKILAHCSAGIGRTGTYCAALGAYRAKSLDVGAIVKKLRHPYTGRCQMVQTAAQYRLACETARLIAVSPPTRAWSLAWRSSHVSSN